MRRPRVKCILCGKRRVPAKGVGRYQDVYGNKLNLRITWEPSQPVCQDCDEKIYDWLLSGLWENI